MKPRMLLAVCLVLAATVLALRGCQGSEGGDLSNAAAGKRSGAAGVEGGDDGESSGGKASKTPRRATPPAQAFIRNKLKSIIIPKISFEDTTLEEAIDFMRLRTRELDPDPDPRMRGISIMIGKSVKSESDDSVLDSATKGAGSLRITGMEMENVSAWDLLHLIAKETGMQVEIIDTGIVIGPR